MRIWAPACDDKMISLQYHTPSPDTQSPSLVSWMRGSCRPPQSVQGPSSLPPPSLGACASCPVVHSSQLLDVSSAFPFLQSDPRAGRQTAGIRAMCRCVESRNAGAHQHTTVVPAPLTGPHWTGVTAVASQPHM